MKTSGNSTPKNLDNLQNGRGFKRGNEDGGKVLSGAIDTLACMAFSLIFFKDKARAL